MRFLAQLRTKRKKVPAPTKRCIFMNVDGTHVILANKKKVCVEINALQEIYTDIL